MDEPRFAGCPVRVWDGLAGAAALLTLMALLVGTFLGAREYVDRKQTSRASETLEMIEVWETRGALDAYSDLNRQLTEMLKDIPESEVRNADKDTLRENLSRRALRSSGQDGFERIVYFFTRLSLCVEADLCSAPVASAFFEDTLTDFLDWFGPEIERRRRLDREFGVELYELLEAFDE